jgi:hypothetical protein
MKVLHDKIGLTFHGDRNIMQKKCMPIRTPRSDCTKHMPTELRGIRVQGRVVQAVVCLKNITPFLRCRSPRGSLTADARVGWGKGGGRGGT